MAPAEWKSQILSHLHANPLASAIRVFGSMTRPGADPKDIDIFIDLRETGRDRETCIGELSAILALGRKWYGYLDPFYLDTDGVLYVRDEYCRSWVWAKNARRIIKAGRAGTPVQLLMEGHRAHEG